MSRKNVGIVGGVVLVVAAFMTATGFGFAASAVKMTTSGVALVAGLGVVVFLLMGNRLWASYGAVVATTAIGVYAINVARATNLDNAWDKIVVMAIGAVLALAGTLGQKK